jgi:hypothetical protein
VTSNLESITSKFRNVTSNSEKITSKFRNVTLNLESITSKARNLASNFEKITSKFRNVTSNAQNITLAFSNLTSNSDNGASTIAKITSKSRNETFGLANRFRLSREEWSLLDVRTGWMRINDRNFSVRLDRIFRGLRPTKTAAFCVMMKSELVFGCLSRFVSRTDIFLQCQTFIDEPYLAQAPYHVRSRVSPSSFDHFVAVIEGASPFLTMDNSRDLAALSEEFGFSNFAHHIAAFDPDLAPTLPAEDPRRLLCRFATDITEPPASLDFDSDGEPQYNMGICLEFGLRIPRNARAAAACYGAAAARRPRPCARPVAPGALSHARHRRLQGPGGGSRVLPARGRVRARGRPVVLRAGARGRGRGRTGRPARE